MANQNSTIGNLEIDARGRVRTAYSGIVGLTLRLRRTWYADPPPAGDPPADPPTPPPAQGQATFSAEQQKLVDAEISNARKKAKDTARKELLKELGIEDADDPKAIEGVKGKLTIAQQAEAAKAAADEAAKTELQKLQDQLTTVQKERDTEKQARAEVEARRIADKVDGRIEALASKSPFSAVDPGDVSRWLRENHKDEVAALIGDNEKIDDAAAAKLIEKAKAAKAHWFAQARGAGTPSLSGGRTPGMDDKEARDANWKQARRG